MKEIHSEIEIQASPDQIWKILTDFRSYPEWNPFIVGIEGTPRTDSRLSVRAQAPGKSARTFQSRVLRFDRNRELRWLTQLWGVGGLFDREHVFSIEPVDTGRVRFVQQETFRGLLMPLLGGAVNNTQQGLDAMNRALKARAEGTAGT